MIEGCPSDSALHAAMRRAAHQLLDRPLVFEDPLALRILTPAGAARVRKEDATNLTPRSSPRSRAFFAARSRLAEDSLLEAMKRGVRQYVLLGAGLDTFAYRARARFPELRVFEVDDPVTQAWKRERLREAGIAVPDTLTFVPVDLASQELGEILARAGFDARATACFAWLGVSMYLAEPAVMATLRFVAACAPGSTLVFDYAVPPPWRFFLTRWRARRTARRGARPGEPWLSRFAPATIAEALHGMGIDTVTDYGPAELHSRYFADRADGLLSGTACRMVVANLR